MKKRLRKKKRAGEFQELGFTVRFGMDPGMNDDQQTEVLEDFIESVIEANGLQFGGGGGGSDWAGFVALDRRGSATEEHRAAVRNWLEQNTKISNVVVGELRDAWHYGDDGHVCQ